MLGPSRRLTVVLLAAVMILVGHARSLPQISTRRSESSVIRLEAIADQTQANGRQLTVEVGDSTCLQFEPTFNLTGWNGQAEFRVNLATECCPLESAERQVTVRNDQPMIRLTGMTCEHELYLRADGNFEWSLIINEIPDDTVYRYQIEARGLRVFYQDTLSAEEIANGAVRPDSVIGSYAVYHATGRGGVRHEDDYLSRYGCGKAFHVYRPRVWDTSGDTVWAAIAIDTTDGLLSLTLNGHWLADAVYPVTVDPTFGTTAVGGSTMGVGSTDVLHCQFASSTSTGTLDSLTWYLKPSGLSPDVGYAMYESKPGYEACSLLVDTSVTQYTVPISPSGGWYGLEMAENASITASTEYWLSLGVMDASCNAYYDDTDADTTAGYYNDPWPFGDPCACCWIAYASNRTYSVYGTFTCDNCPTTGRRRRSMLPGERN